MDAVSTGRSGDASPGHASLTWVIRLFQAGFQSPWKANYDWLLAQTASPSFFRAVAFLEACGARPGAADFLCRDLWRVEGYPGCHDLLREKGNSGCRDLLMEGDPINMAVPRRVGHITPLYEHTPSLAC